MSYKRVPFRAIKTMIAGLIVALVSLSKPALAQNLTPEQIDFMNDFLNRFRLFNDCQPISILIEPLSDDEKKVGLTDRILKLRTERILRSARLYSKPLLDEYLHVNVNVAGKAFSISLEYTVEVTNKYGRSGRATTWDKHSFGTHGGDPNYILSSLSGHMDAFVVAYLRANEDACKGRENRDAPDADGYSGPTAK